MGAINATTGHSAKGERRIAGILYVAITIAVLVGLSMAFWMGSHGKFNPFHSGDAAKTAPDTTDPNPSAPGGLIPPQTAPSEQQLPQQNPQSAQ